MESVCSRFLQGELSHNSGADVITQLRTEGKKRIDAFVFELLFRRRIEFVINELPDFVAAFGWHVGYNKYGQPEYWFRLMENDSDWNACDDALVVSLRSKPVLGTRILPQVFRVKFSATENDFLADAVDGVERDWRLLKKIVGQFQRKGLTRPPRDMTGAQGKNIDEAIEWLSQGERKSALNALSIQRRFVNCVIGPMLGRDVTDIDAIVLSPDGGLVYIEFKRKYPAFNSRSFGLDMTPHISLMNVMSNIRIRFLHMILVPPLWEKEGSPVKWMANAELEPKWIWLVGYLGKDSISGRKLTTTGADSGQRNAVREQMEIDWKFLKILHGSLKLGDAGKEKLKSLLITGQVSDLPPASFEFLDNSRVRRG